MTRHRALALLLLGLTPLSAQALPAPTQADDTAYMVGPGDQLTVTVYRAPNYSGLVEVAADGTVPVNDAGRVVVLNKTAAQVSDAIAAALRTGGYLRDPIVNVLVQTYRARTVSVLGAVAKPGEYPLDRGGMTITEILARAGATLGVGGGTVRLLRHDGTQQDLAADQVLAGTVNQRLEPHDTLIVTESATFYISGEVQRPGSFPLEPGLTMERAVALAGGITQRGARTRLKVSRHSGDADQLIRAKPQDPVKPRDLITVGARLF